MRRVIVRLLGSPWWSALVAGLAAGLVLLAQLDRKPGAADLDGYALSLVLLLMLAATIYQFITRKPLNAVLSLGLLLLVEMSVGVLMLAVHFIHDSEKAMEWYGVEVQLPDELGKLTLHYQSAHAPDPFPVPGSERYYSVVYSPKKGHETAVDLGMLFGRPDFDLFLVTNGNRRVLDVDYTDGGSEPKHVYFDLTLRKQIDGFKGKATRLGTISPTELGKAGDYTFIPPQPKEPPADGGLFHPVTVTLDLDGNVYAMDESYGILAKYSPDGEFLAKWSFGPESGHETYALAIDRSGSVWAIGMGSAVLRKYGPDGHLLAEYGRSKSEERPFENLPFDAPWGLACDRDGNLYITHKTCLVRKVSPSGKIMLKWGPGGRPWSRGFDPAGLAIAPNGHVLVANRSDGIQEYSPAGKLLGRWGVHTGSWWHKGYPVDVKTDKAGNVYVAVWYKDRLYIEKHDTGGEFMLQWIPDIGRKVDGPVSIAAGDGCVYIADEKNHRLLKYTDKGEWLANWGCSAKKGK